MGYPDLSFSLTDGGGPRFGVGGPRLSPGFESPLFEGSFLGPPCPYYMFDILQATNQFTVDASSFVVSAEEYWEYDPGDGGGPIWDSTTGEQIRDRWSVQQWS